MQLKVSIDQLRRILIFVVALLPLQLTFVLMFKLPSFLMLINIIIFLLIVFVIVLPAKYKKITVLKKHVFLIYIGLFLINLISVLINYPSIIEKSSYQFAYYVRQYSPFWDSAEISSIYSGIIRPTIYFIFFYTLCFVFQTEKHLKFIYKILLSIAIVSCLYSLYQIPSYMFGLPFGSITSGHDGEVITYLGMRRTEGIFYEGGPHATYLSFVFSLFIYQIFKTPYGVKKIKKIGNGLVLMMLLITLLTTLSPIGILTPLIVFPILIIQNWKKLHEHSRLLIIVGILLGVLSVCCFHFGGNGGCDEYTIMDFIKYRLNGEFKNEAFAGDLRSVRNRISIDIIRDHPFIGIGAGNDGFYYTKYAAYATGGLPKKNIIINNNLKILADTGVLGFLLYLSLLIYPYYYYKKTKLSKYKSTFFIDKMIDSLFVSELLFVVLTFQSQTEFLQPTFWILYSMLISAIDIKKKKLVYLSQNALIEHIIEGADS